ncbi:MAG: class II aldolase/adducin family protein [Kiritimatiellia bacterium]|jgi:rhamnose utilization protein RhaD (predicted bifunctional aldolase and dehydrogenase)|nr:class II aldolase/adducin family protein [Kiritimatiellia bacterium]MDP6629706.1 class II aldolase/adducin family protein [Kiritimatiellia bacterium]MDP6810945.1 class II aldolase/adducin family protein [Kiritimatiellia bacterium]MDP7023250.1 class II aldolase/adducin family protein [Kiritimatiellia bacterium]
MTDLDTIVALSHEFGTENFVKGGGGNTSVKDANTLWVKPSGTTLAGLSTDTFVSMNRAKISELYAVETPTEPAAREELVKNLMAEAVENDAGRPSVEAPLHNVFDATYVVHTHPALVNGLTCARGGGAACRELLPDALWVEYIDPGYTLCMAVRERIQEFRQARGCEPALLVLQNHGIFIGADTADGIRALYRHVMDLLKGAYETAGVSMELAVAASEAAPDTEATIRKLFGNDAAFIASSGMFPTAPGPITPDHLVYAKAFPFVGDLTAEAVRAYTAERGYAPKVVVAGNRVYGIGASQKNADLALELAQDGALVIQLTEAFGGIHTMSDAQREFIENWEVESYRSKQV